MDRLETTPVYEAYWRFAAERQALYFRRLSNPVGPWTSDPIISKYRFTNVYRASDRVSQFLIREVQYREDRSQNPRELFFRTILFKLFNRIDTWIALENELGPLSFERSDFDKIVRVLNDLMRKGERLYSAAYIMPSPPMGRIRKHENHLVLLRQMIDDQLPDRIHQAPSLQNVFEYLLRYPGIGKFLAFQYTIDLNYSMLLNHDESEFVVAGPGAIDGISKCFSNLGRYSPEEAIAWVCENQERAFAAAGISFKTLFGRRLQLIDCQNLFCEISKYARISHPEIRGTSGRVRIKQSYNKSSGTIPSPQFPPKWSLHIPQNLQA